MHNTEEISDTWAVSGQTGIVEWIRSLTAKQRTLEPKGLEKVMQIAQGRPESKAWDCK